MTTNKLADYRKLVAFMLRTFGAKSVFKGNVHVYRKCPRCGYSAALIFKSDASWHLACPKCRKHEAKVVERRPFEASDCCDCGSPSIERCRDCNSVDAPTPAELDQAARESDAAEKAAKKSSNCDSCGKRRKLNANIVPGMALCKQCVSDANKVDM